MNTERRIKDLIWKSYVFAELHLSHLKNKEEENKKQNETTLGENCCACPKSEEEERLEEEERMFQIEFENFLHNNVYLKRLDVNVYIKSFKILYYRSV